MHNIHEIGPSMSACRPRVLALGAAQEGGLVKLERQATDHLRGRLGELSRHICGAL